MRLEIEKYNKEAINAGYRLIKVEIYGEEIDFNEETESFKIPKKEEEVTRVRFYYEMPRVIPSVQPSPIVSPVVTVVPIKKPVTKGGKTPQTGGVDPFGIGALVSRILAMGSFGGTKKKEKIRMKSSTS